MLRSRGSRLLRALGNYLSRIERADAAHGLLKREVVGPHSAKQAHKLWLTARQYSPFPRQVPLFTRDKICPHVSVGTTCLCTTYSLWDLSRLWGCCLYVEVAEHGLPPSRKWLFACLLQACSVPALQGKAALVAISNLSQSVGDSGRRRGRLLCHSH